MNRVVSISIEVLTVEGLNSAQAAMMSQAFQQTLAELARVQGLPQGLQMGGDAPSLEIEGFEILPHQLEHTGAELARAIYRRLDQ